MAPEVIHRNWLQKKAAGIKNTYGKNKQKNSYLKQRPLNSIPLFCKAIGTDG